MKMASGLPLELLEKIFSNLHSKSLILSCRGVCRTWRDVIDNQVLVRRALVTPELRSTYHDQNFQVYYQIEQIYGRNLLRNIHFLLRFPADLRYSINGVENSSMRYFDLLFDIFCTLLYLIRVFW